MNFKALFIIPSQEKVYGLKMPPPYPPLGILYICSVLKNIGVELNILDMDADKLTYKKLLLSIGEFKPNIIGLTASTPIIGEAFNLSNLIKKKFPIPIILGGIHPTMNAQDCIKHPSIDFIIKGEGEDTIKELISEIIQKKCDFEKIRGLYYKRNQDSYFSGERELIADLDRIPYPARELLNNFSNYRPPDAERLPVASIMTTRGCPGRCTYCCTQNMFKNKYRMRSIDNVLEEIEEIIGRFKVREIHIADDAFNANRQRTLKLCEAIAKKNYRVDFEFLNGLRADRIDKDILDAFKSIGIRNVGFGLEHVNKGILRNVDKDIMPEAVESSLKLAKAKGFKTWVFFMIGLPGENESTIKENIAFAKKIDPDFAKFLIFKPFPGSAIYRQMKQEGLIDDLNSDNYGVYTPPVHHLPNLAKDELLYWQKKAFREFYFRPKKIWDHIKRQKSLAQLKLSLQGFLFVCFNAFKRAKQPDHQ